MRENSTLEAIEDVIEDEHAALNKKLYAALADAHKTYNDSWVNAHKTYNDEWENICERYLDRFVEPAKKKNRHEK